MKRIVTLWVLMGFAGCVSRPVPAKPVVQKLSFQTFYVQTLQGDLRGDVTRDLMQALRAAGYKIQERQQGADATLSGVVNDHKLGRKLMVYLGNTRTVVANQPVTVSNPIVSTTGSRVLPQNAAMAMNQHLVAENAMLSLSARLTDSAKGQLVWAYEFTYESLDQPTARRAVVATVTQSFRRAFPPHDAP